ncbi:MAG TPA: AraC family transcriptional regulator [Clostridia bacterium]|nr:AraC family transcriptional regulator [Clostridia bacterium]
MPIQTEEDCAVGAIHGVLERRREPGWNFGHNPGRPNAGLVLILEGQMRLERGGIRTVYGPDCLIYLEKGLHYQIAIEGENMLHFLVVNFEILLGRFPLEADIAVTLAGESARRVRAWCVQMAACFETQEPLYRLRVRSLFQQVLYEIAHARNRTGAPGNPRVEAALDYLRRYYGAEIGVPDVARAIGLSVTHLRRLFVEQLNVPPHAYLQRLRMERAKMLLQGGLHSVTEVAALCGFSSVYAFSRAFKQETGLPPTGWRE